jgi:hypothetical protein
MPCIVSPDGKSRTIQVPCKGNPAALLERSEEFILIALSTGALLLLDPSTLLVLDAVQVRPSRTCTCHHVHLLSGCALPSSIHGAAEASYQ